MVTIKLRQLSVPEGQTVLLHDVNWGEFEAILHELGEHRAARLAYSNGTLEIRMPLPEHEVNKEIIGDLVKILLEELEIDCECFGSTTFKREDMLKGLEPDQCFYLKNHEAMRGKLKVDLTVDPPPDLAIEIDVTSKTKLTAYEGLGVSELWRYEHDKLQINVLVEGKYIHSNCSLAFANLPIQDIIPQFIKQSKTLGRSPMLRAFRKYLREHLNHN